MEPLLTGIVVHWHNEEQLAALTAAWPRDPRFELLVVDNGSSGPLDEPRVAPARLLQPGRNLGFAGGANAGIAAARAPIVLLLNPDAVPEEGALDELLAGFAAWPDAAGLAPRMTGPAGEPQFAWQLRRLPSPASLLLHALPLGGSQGGLTTEPPAGAPVEQPAAAALALRRAAVEAIGGLDAGFWPAWFEDVDLARRLAAAGQVLRYQPAARFRHGLGGTVPRLGYGPFLWIYDRNLVRYLRKHHGAAWALTARVLLVVGVLIRLLLLPVRRPNRAASRGEALRGLLLVLGGVLTGWRTAGPPTPTLPREAGEGAPARPESERLEDQGSPDLAATAEDPSPSPAPRGRGQGWGSFAVCIVTHNSAADLPGCLESVGKLEPRPLEIVVVDCASADGSLDVARRQAPPGIAFQAVDLGENRGFTGGMNAALAASLSPWVLALNADARPAPDYVARLLARAEVRPELRVGALIGRLLRPVAADGTRRLDACGMRLTRTWRHLDRGSGEADHGQYPAAERVFGASGAASLYRREALEDAAVDGEIFDTRFHSFREDAELCFRLRERGWEIVYEPAAVAEHRRFNLPERRSAMPAAVNYHSLKNRYLLRLYHQTAGNFLRTLLPTLVRDLLAIGWVVLAERGSLAAYGWLWAHRREILRRRRAIQDRRTVPAAAIDRWFSSEGEPL
jgi:GT2 family glycosyltransferase